jgi:hypothetical protein
LVTDEDWLKECEAHKARMAYNEACLQETLGDLREACGTHDPLSFHLGSCGFASGADAIETLVACVDALAARVAILENQ